jgi:hypothetical protein
MNLDNSTAAGPSRGLLDVLFGTKGPEAEGADGQGFKPLMELIKALKENGEKESGDRTDEEIASGKNLAEGQVVVMPGMFPFLPEQMKVEPETVEMPEAMKAPGVPAAETLKPADVNQLLQERAMPKLSPDEEKLLAEVNTKLAAVVALPKNMPGMQGNEKATEAAVIAAAAKAAESPKNAEVVKDSRVPEEPGKTQPAAVTAGGAPAPLVSTEAFLRLHQGAEKNAQKTNDQNGEVMASAVAAKAAVEQKSTEQSGAGKGDLLGGGEREMPVLHKDKAAVRGHGPEQPAFDSSLVAQLKGDSAVKEVHIQSVNPTEVRNALIGEVSQGVGFQAIKGGGEMRLVIRPDSLGEVKLQVSNKEGKIEVKVIAENENVAKIIRGGSQDLEGSLRTQNLVLSKLDVSVAEGVTASSDSKQSSGEQLFQQHRNHEGNFHSQGGGTSDRGLQQWGAGPEGDSGGRQSQANNSNGYVSEEVSASSSASSKRVRDNSRRLDVVA